MKKTLEARFWPKVNKDGPVVREELGPCWIWTGGCDRCGYGMIRVDGKYRGTHRVSWQIHNGERVDGALVLHRCDTPPCVNPAHLFRGTYTDNMVDMVRKGRNVVSAGERNGKAVLTDTEVADMRRRFADDGVSVTDLASIFRTPTRSVRQIVRYQRRAEVIK